MGGNINEQEQQNVPAQSRPYELPQNLVQVEKPFAMSTYETTIAEFQAFQKETGWEVEGAVIGKREMVFSICGIEMI